MREREAIRHFENEINAVIERFRLEYKLSVASAVGVLEIVKTTITLEAIDNHADDDE